MNECKTQYYRKTIQQATILLNAVQAESPFPPRLERAALTENWFSDQLAWLLDPEGSHGFGTLFSEEFLKVIARVRTKGHPDTPSYYHRKKFLRWHRSKIAGTRSTLFDLRNAGVFREFYLARVAKGKKSGTAMLCDIVFLDLDPQDGLFVAIENKLFTTNHPGQIERYHKIIEDRYHRAKVLEYVYLTLLGDPPNLTRSKGSKKCERTWVRVSWVHDILPILESLDPDLRRRNGLGPVMRVLRWLKAICDKDRREEVGSVVRNVFEGLAAASSACLVNELERLNEGARGHWKVPKAGRRRTRIIHSSKPTVPLYVGVQPNLSIVLFSDKKCRKNYEKLLIPFGSNVDQIYNLMDLVARDIYHLHFGPSSKKYLGGARRLRTQELEVRTEAREFFEFVHEHRHQLKLLVPIVRLSAGNVLLETSPGD